MTFSIENRFNEVRYTVETIKLTAIKHNWLFEEIKWDIWMCWCLWMSSRCCRCDDCSKNAPVNASRKFIWFSLCAYLCNPTKDDSEYDNIAFERRRLCNARKFYIMIEFQMIQCLQIGKWMSITASVAMKWVFRHLLAHQ